MTRPSRSVIATVILITALCLTRPASNAQAAGLSTVCANSNYTDPANSAAVQFGTFNAGETLTITAGGKPFDVQINVVAVAFSVTSFSYTFPSTTTYTVLSFT